MALWLHLHLSDLALEVLTRGRGPGRSEAREGGGARPAAPLIAVVDAEGSRASVVACSAAARAAGLEPGMRLGAARALAGVLEVHYADRGAQAAARREVAAWATQFSSLVSLDDTPGVSLEVAGSAKLFGGLDALLSRVQDGVRRLGFSHRSAVAPTATAACLLARAAAGPPGPAALPDAWRRGSGAQPVAPMLETLLAPIRLVHLDLSEPALRQLRGMGLRTIGDCLPLPRAGLNRRVQGVLAILDRALGRVPDPRQPYRPPARFEQSIPLPAPVVEVAALLFAANRLLHALCGYLQGQMAGVSVLRMGLGHEREARRPAGSCPETTVRLRLVAPSRDPVHLLGLLKERLERIALTTPVERVSLAVEERSALAPSHLDLFETNSAEEGEQSFPRLLERLEARLGARAVRGLALCADHRPERAWATCPPCGEIEAPPLAPAPGAPRPLWLLPEPLALSTAQARPLKDGALRLIRPERPECIESGWWDDADVSRDYYLASNPHGEMLWIFRDRRGGGWYLHGVFA